MDGGGGRRGRQDTDDAADDEAELTPQLAVGKRTGAMPKRTGPVPRWPGKRSLTQGLLRGSSVQRKATGEPVTSSPIAIATQGTAGAGGALPHLEQIQQSFGRHDVSNIGAHVGGGATEASEQLGARAYAVGESVGFASSPDLHTAAHEAAHVVQQRGGVQLEGGLDTPGDGYEQHADAVADAVVAGRFAEGLLDQQAGDKGGAPVVQRDASEPAPVGALEFIDYLPALVAFNIAKAIEDVGLVKSGPFIKYLHEPDVVQENLIKALGLEHHGDRDPISGELARLVAPESLVALVDHARRRDPIPKLGSDGKPEKTPDGKGVTVPGPTGPSSHIYYEPVGLELMKALARRYVESMKRVVPRLAGAVKPNTTVKATDITISHPMDRAVANALCASNDCTVSGIYVSFVKLREDHAELFVPEAPRHENVTVRFPVERGLYHWVEASPVDATAEEVAMQLFGATDQAYRLTAMAPLWGFRTADIKAFIPDKGAELKRLGVLNPNDDTHEDEHIAADKRIDADMQAGAYGGQTLGGGPVQVPYSERKVPDIDPMGELAATEGASKLAIERAKAATLDTTPHDEAAIYDRANDAIRLLSQIEKNLIAMGQPTDSVLKTATAQRRLRDDATKMSLDDPNGRYALVDAQGKSLARISHGTNEAMMNVLSLGGISDKQDTPDISKVPEVARAPLLEAVDAYLAGMVAIDFPEVANPRIDIADDLLRNVRIRATENGLHQGMPVLEGAENTPEDRRKDGADYDPVALEHKTNEEDLELARIRIQMQSNPLEADQKVNASQGRVGDLEFEIAVVGNLEALDALWKGVDDERGFWESTADELGGEALKITNAAFYAQFKKDVYDVYRKGQLTHDDALKKQARTNFNTLVNKPDFIKHAEAVRDFITDTEKHKRWTKIIVSIAIAVAAFALGQWAFSGMLLAEATVFEASIVAGVVTTTTSAALEKLILDHDPSLGEIITGFVGNVGMFFVMGKLALAAKAAGTAGELAEATKDASLIAKGAKKLGEVTKELILVEALGAVQGNAAKLIDSGRLLTADEMKDMFVQQVIGLIGFKVGQHMLDASLAPFKKAGASHGIDIEGLMAEQGELKKMADELTAASKVPGSKPDTAKVQEFLTRQRKYLEREAEARRKLIELVEKNPEKFKKSEVEQLEKEPEGPSSDELRRVQALTGIEEVGPGLFRADPLALDAILTEQKATHGKIEKIETDPHTGQRTVTIKPTDGPAFEIKEKLADVGNRKPRAVTVAEARAFESWMDSQLTNPGEIARLREYYARDPMAAIRLASEHYKFDAQSLADGSDVIVKSDAAEKPAGKPGAKTGGKAVHTDPMAAAADSAYEHYEYERADEPKDVDRRTDDRVMKRDDFESMYRQGFEYDPVADKWRLREGSTSAGKAGVIPPGGGGGTQVLGEVHSEAVGHQLMRKLVAGEAEALRAVGIEPPKGFDPQSNEWGLGRRKSDQAIVLIRGGKGEVDWSEIPDIEDLGHSHPLNDPRTGKPRLIEGTDKSGSIDVKNLGTTASDNDLLYLLPSTGDLRFVALGDRGGHVVHTPYVHLGNGRIGNPQPGVMADTVEIVIGQAKPHKLLAPNSEVVIWKADVQIWAGNELLTSTTIYQGRLVSGSFAADMPSAVEKSSWADIPPDHPAVKATAPSSTPMGDQPELGKVDLHTAEQLQRTWKVDLGDPNVQASLKGLSFKDVETLKWIMEESSVGRTQVGFSEWIKRLSDPAQRADAMKEAKLVRRELAADPVAKASFDASGKALISGATRTDVPGFVIDHVTSVSGTAGKKLQQYEFATPAELAAATDRVRAAAQAAGEKAYTDALGAGEPQKDAAAKATNATNKKIIEAGQQEGKAAAEKAARDAIQSGTAFETSKLDAQTQTQLADYNSAAPTVGVRARQLAGQLPGMREADFLKFMAGEPAAHGANARAPIKVPAPPAGSPNVQDMLMWEYPDGSEVRYKPRGDNDRPGTPMFSIEVKKNPALPDSGRDDAAFKLDRHGNAAPKKHEGELHNPFKGDEQKAAFKEAAMQEVHFELKP